MKLLTTGTDPDGRACVLETRHLDGSVDAMGGEQIFHTDAVRPEIPPRATEGFVPAAAWTEKMPPNPGEVTWMVVQFPPGAAYERHQTPTIDFDTVLAGSIVLTLDDGEHALAAGDCVVIAGIDHAWHAGEEGCALAVLMLGAVNRE